MVNATLQIVISVSKWGQSLLGASNWRSGKSCPCGAIHIRDPTGSLNKSSTIGIGVGMGVGVESYGNWSRYLEICWCAVLIRKKYVLIGLSLSKNPQVHLGISGRRIRPGINPCWISRTESLNCYTSFTSSIYLNIAVFACWGSWQRTSRVKPISSVASSWQVLHLQVNELCYAEYLPFFIG